MQINSRKTYGVRTRAIQLKEAVSLLSGKKLPAYCAKSPDLYVLCKENETSMAAGLFNCFADDVINPVVELGTRWDNIEFINCTGRLEGDKVLLDTISPFGFAGFEVRKN